MSANALGRRRLLAVALARTPLRWRVGAALVVSYSVLGALSGHGLLVPWLLGLLCALLGAGALGAARNLTPEALRCYGQGAWTDPMVWLEVGFRHLPLPVARRVEQAIGVVLLGVGSIIAAGTAVAITVASVRSIV